MTPKAIYANMDTGREPRMDTGQEPCPPHTGDLLHWLPTSDLFFCMWVTSIKASILNNLVFNLPTMQSNNHLSFLNQMKRKATRLQSSSPFAIDDTKQCRDKGVTANAHFIEVLDTVLTELKCKKMASCFRTLTKGMGYDQIRDVAPCTRKKYWRIACADRVNQIDKKCHKLENLIYPGNTQKHMRIWFI